MLKKDVAAALLFAALSIAMTWPLAVAPDRAVAYPGDPYINLWILDWDWWATFHQPLELFHGNVLYPAKYSLAFSEHLYGVAILLFPLRTLGAGPLVAYNIAVIAGFAFAGFAAYLLGRVITGSALAGVVAGIFFMAVPFRFTHVVHVQHLWTGWLPMMLVALIHYARRPTWARAALFGAAFLMNGLTNMHWFLFGSLAIGLTIPIVVREPRRWVALAAALVVALLLLAPFLIPYAKVSELYGMKRGWGEAKLYSAELKDWLNPGITNRFYRAFADRSVDPERWIGPGFLGIVLTIAGFSLRRSPIAALWLLLGVIGSLGLHTFFHRFLFTYVPGFQALRVPARWAMIGYLGMAIAIAFAVAALVKRHRAFGVVIAVLFLIELRAAPIRWFMASPHVPEVYDWIAQTKPRAIATLPMDVNEVEYLYMRYAAAHHRPVVNGISGFISPELIRLTKMANATPVDPALRDELAKLGVEIIVVHGDLLLQRSDDTRAWLRRELERGALRFVRRFENGVRGDWVFSTVGGQGPIPNELRDYLDGKFTYNASTFGQLDYPLPGEKLPQAALFSGWAFSPHGIRQVNFVFDNGQVRVPAKLIDDPSLEAGFPWYPNVPHPRFIAHFPSRPKNIRPDTDVQVEIIDGAGKRTWLEGRHINW